MLWISDGRELKTEQVVAPRKEMEEDLMEQACLSMSRSRDVWTSVHCWRPDFGADTVMLKSRCYDGANEH